MWVILRINCLCTFNHTFTGDYRTAEIVLEEGFLPKKNLKLSDSAPIEVKVTNSDMDEYQRNIKTLKMSYESKKWTLNGLKSLMTETSGIVTVGNC